jgi:hypothetical protein
MMDCLLAKVHHLLHHPRCRYTPQCSNCLHDIHTTSPFALTSPISPLSLLPVDHPTTVHSVRDGLRHGRAREARVQVQASTQAGQGPTLRAYLVHARGHVR